MCVFKARLGQKQALWWNDGIAKYFWVLVPLYDCPLFQSTGSIYTERAEITAISAILPYLSLRIFLVVRRIHWLLPALLRYYYTIFC
jgi:hypothetical protein